MSKVLSMTRQRILMETLNCYGASYRRDFNFYKVGESIFDDENILNLGINWSAIGTVSTDETIEFASELIRGASFANKVNDLKIVYRYGDEEDIEEKTYEEEFAMLCNAAWKKDYDTVYEWIVKNCREEE